MKIRNGFVSNSSSSSFVVKIRDFFDRNLLTQDQMEILREYGFVRTCNNLFYIDALLWDLTIRQDGDSGDNYAFRVTCNEDYVINFLISNKIPFEGLTHYGQWAIIYDGNERGEYWRIPNAGNRFLMYGISPHDKPKEEWLCR